MPKRSQEELNPFELIQAGLSQSAKKPNNLMYKPHDKQILFHSSEKKGRQYIGGNRSGKTTAGINEDIWNLRGQHPYKSVPPAPVLGRICTVDFKNGANKIIIPNLRQWMPPSLLINGSWEDSYNGQNNVLTCSNGSELEIMSYDQDLDKFAGVPRHFIHFDEEPPQDIYDECILRLVDYGGKWWMTMTPVEGMTWTYEQIFEPSENGDNPLIDVIKVKIQDNTFLNTSAILEVLDGLNAEQMSIRAAGDYIAIGGLVFQHFRKDTHVLPYAETPPPKHWTHYLSLDAGYNNPTAVLWHAVAPSGEVITYREHYKSEMTTQQHAEVINEKNRQLRDEFGIIPFLQIADPAIEQRQQTTGHSIRIEYAKHGLNFVLGRERNINAGLDKMNDYLRTNKWYIRENCVNLLKEMKTYKRAQYATSKLRDKNNKREEPQKKNDHAIDSTRYFFSFMPELRIDERKPPVAGEGRQAIASLLSVGASRVLDLPVYDPNLQKKSEAEEFPVIYDDYGDY